MMGITGMQGQGQGAGGYLLIPEFLCCVYKTKTYFF